MIFNSLEYFLFLPAVWLVHHFLCQRLRWLFLLAASLIFYASLKVPYLLGVITLVTVATYGFGRWIHRAEQPKQKRWLLWGGIVTNILILVVMKYVPFLIDNLNALLSVLDSPIKAPNAQLFVAIGVSYYIFQAISYLSDIYLEIEEPEPHFGYFALYLAFFPKLLQGPIERARDLLPQFKKKYEFDYDNIRFGLLLFTWGLFKKVVLADRLGLYVDAVYDDVYAHQGLPLLLATYAYAFQIYFDFSGYTDMALGTARLFNIKLTDNFNSPYLATSIAEFWRRWHITFSRWILDYVFKPLQLSWRDWKSWGTAAALTITFFISGLWHGASWGFILWGLLHGLYMACSVFYRPWQRKLHKASNLEKTRLLKAWQVLVTFHLVCFAWVFFRMTELKDAAYLIGRIIDPATIHDLLGWRLPRSQIFAGIDSFEIKVLIVAFIATAIVANRAKVNLLEKSRWVRWPIVYILLFAVIFLGKHKQSSFIYFSF